VYCSTPGTFSLATGGVLTLDAENDQSSQWIFQATTSVITGAGSSINFVNGGQANNVYWAVGTSVTTGTKAHFIGNILAQTSITLGYLSTLNGRTIAKTTVAYAGSVATVLPLEDSIAVTATPIMSPAATPIGIFTLSSILII
jgi:hypothetical protein